MEWAAAQGLTEFMFHDGRTRVTIRRAAGVCRTTEPKTVPSARAIEAKDVVTAPLGGICHLASEPGGAPFVTEGATIEAGHPICVIEAMKVMTTVPAPRGGVVGVVMVSDGATVEAGTPLVRIR
ncbi:MAG: acetyl-CoA carboxylase biotin carboxyl carrier protein subunit [Roseivivax sp.]|nr:acetyl-CoA carboxylase biotin carboxyl carrier protein subunit [Roseivivax sp.]